MKELRDRLEAWLIQHGFKEYPVYFKAGDRCIHDEINPICAMHYGTADYADR